MQQTKKQSALITDLQSGDIIPSGVSFMGSSPCMLFDIDNLDESLLETILSSSQQEKIEKLAENEAKYFQNPYFAKNDLEPDAYLFAVAKYALLGARKLLGITKDTKPNAALRDSLYRNEVVSLSDIKEHAMCTELSAVGQYILQHHLDSDYESSLAIGAILMADGDTDQHAFIPIFDKKSKKQYVFDIARPEVINMPRISLLSKPFTFDYFVNHPGKIITGKTQLTKLRECYWLD